MIKYFIYLMFLLVLISSFGCGDSSGNEESQSLPPSSTETDTETSSVSTSTIVYWGDNDSGSSNAY